MKPAFITLTDKNSHPIVVNPNLIAYMSWQERHTMTYIQFGGDDQTGKSVKETPEQIQELIKDAYK